MALSKQVPEVYAHRAGTIWAPENTLAGISLCLRNGVTGIEVDVRRCATGELFLRHDLYLESTTDGTGSIARTSYRDMRRLRARARGSQRSGNQSVPLLTEALELIAGRAVLNIEVKNAYNEHPGIDDELLRVLEPYSHKHAIMISSFDHQLLRRIHEKAPQYHLAVIFSTVIRELFRRLQARSLTVRLLKVLSGSTASLCTLARETGARSCHLHRRFASRTHTLAARKAGLESGLWLINDKTRLQNARTLGVDRIFTDDPIHMLDLLSA